MSPAEVAVWLGAIALLAVGSFHYGRISARLYSTLPDPSFRNSYNARDDYTKEQTDIAEAAMLLAIVAVLLGLGALTLLGVLLYKAK